MRPKVRGDLFYFHTSAGDVYVRNNQKAYKLVGRGASRLLDVLLPHLNGQHTLEEITRNLSGDKRDKVEKLITLLVHEGFIQDISHDLPHTLSQAEQQAYEAEITFIGSFVDSAAHRFEQYRESNILLIGSGLTLMALVHAHLYSGLRQIDVMICDECPTDNQRLLDYATLYEARDGRQKVTLITQPDWQNPESVQQVLRPFDAIVHVSDRPMLARAVLLNRLCIQLQKILIQAVIVENHAWIGPLVCNDQPGCWECAWHRLRSNLTDYQTHIPWYAFIDQPAVAICEFVAAPTAAVVANTLSFELFKHIAAAGPLETQARLVDIDLETLDSHRYRFLPHPFCEVCRYRAPQTQLEFQQALQQLVEGSDIDPDTFSKDVSKFFDDKLGLFKILDEHDFMQIPLNISQITLSNPMALTNLPQPIEVFAVGTDFGMSRHNVTQHACEVYATLLCDSRQLMNGSQLADTVPIYTRSMNKASTPERDEQYVWGYMLTSKQVCVLPASIIFPALQGQILSGDTPIGVASGKNWSEALTRALLAHYKQLAIEQISQTQNPFPLVNLTELPLSDPVSRYYHIAEIMHINVSVYDLTGTSAIPVFAFCLANQTIAYACHVDVQEALREGFEKIIRQSQTSLDHQPCYAPSPVPPLPAQLKGRRTTTPQYIPPADWSSSLQRLLQVLERLGYTAIVVPLNHDLELVRVFPYIVHVVLASDQVQR